MYRIKEAAHRSGVSVPLLRAWERRYHVVEPARTASGYRLYDEAAITRLRAVRNLIGQGWSASSAAARVLEEDENGIAQLAQATVGSVAPGTAAGPAELAAGFVDAAAALDEPAFDAVLDEMFARGSFEFVAGEIVLPALRELGERWAAGGLDVAAEHAASAAVLRRLGAAFMAAGRSSEGGDLVLVGMPPGGRHELGALAFATAVRRAGVNVRYLGADLPVENWIEATVRTAALAAVVGVVIDDDVEPARRVAQALQATRPEVIVAFGGHAAHRLSSLGSATVLVLPDDLGASVDMLRGAIRTRRRR
jgi:methanogenic corrinoid protein MtbC1